MAIVPPASTPSLLSQVYPPKPTWTTSNIPDLTGKVAVVTGGYNGIGYESTLALLEHGAKVYILGRSEKTGQDAIASLKAKTSKEAYFIQIDLASLESVKKAATQLLDLETKIDILMLSAGVMILPGLTADNFEMQFGTNVVGHFLLCELLLPLVIKTKDLTGEKGRIVTTSSSANEIPGAKGIQFDSLKAVDGKIPNQLALWSLYGQSKLGNVIVANEIHRRYGDQVVSTSLNPGNIDTGLWKNVSFASLLAKVYLYPASKGCLTQLYAATAPEAASLGGQFLVPWARVGKSAALGRDEELGKQLWEWLSTECAAYL